jgi:hypothetical protein
MKRIKVLKIEIGKSTVAELLSHKPRYEDVSLNEFAPDASGPTRPTRQRHMVDKGWK